MPIEGAPLEPSWHRNHRQRRSALRLLARQPLLLSEIGIAEAYNSLQFHHGSTPPLCLQLAMMQHAGHSYGGKGSMHQHPFDNGGFDPSQHQSGGGNNYSGGNYSHGSWQQPFGGNGSMQHSPQQFGGNSSQQQSFGGKGSQQQFGGNCSSPPFGGNGSSQQFGGNGSSPPLGGKGNVQQQFGGNGSSQPFGGKGMVQQQSGGCGNTHHLGGNKGSFQQQFGGKGSHQQSPGVHCSECNALNFGTNQCWQCKSPLSIQASPGKGMCSDPNAGSFGKGSHAANQWTTGYAKPPFPQPHNYGASTQQASMNSPNPHAPHFVPPPKWCPECGNQCMSHHSYCGMCHHQFHAKGSGKGGSSGNYNFGKGGGTGYSGNTTQPGGGGGAAPDYNLGGDRFTTEMKAFPARIPRCFEVAFEMGDFTYTQSAPLEVQWRECSEFLSASKAMMAKVNNFKAFLHNKENQLTNVALGAWQRRSFLLKTMRSVPQGAVNAHKVDVQQIHRLLESLVPDANTGLKQSLQDVMLQLAPAATPTEPVGQVTFEEQARDFFQEYQTNGMDNGMDLLMIPWISHNSLLLVKNMALRCLKTSLTLHPFPSAGVCVKNNRYHMAQQSMVLLRLLRLPSILLIVMRSLVKLHLVSLRLRKKRPRKFVVLRLWLPLPSL